MEEEKALYTQKVEILSRLIKESSLTLEEALLLLKEEEPEASFITTSPQTSPGTIGINPWWGGTTTPSYGTITIPHTGNMPIVTTASSDSTFSINGTTSTSVLNN